MPLSRFPWFTNPFDSPASIVERQIRLRLLESQEAGQSNLPDAEIDKAIRRSAIVRERLRRLGFAKQRP